MITLFTLISIILLALCSIFQGLAIRNINKAIGNIVKGHKVNGCAECGGIWGHDESCSKNKIQK